MKRIMLLGLAALCMAGFAFCQNVRTFPPMNPGMMPPTGPGMMQPVGNTTQASMVATSDGGIIVLFNNRLIKYDKDLNRLKEENLNAEKGRDTSGVETGIQPPVIHIQKPPQDLGH